MKITKRFDGGSLFAGANSGDGFVSFYDTILSDESIERIYILKGGPGTGKSRFMRDAAERASALGMTVERYNCSSDPDSLDAVVLGGRYAILDGTPPHSVDPHLAGAREEIINLGAFWDSAGLSKCSDKIKELSRGKGESYKKAYRYLSAYKNVCDINSELILPCFKQNKAERAVERQFLEIKQGGGHRVSVGMIYSVGMKGKVRYDTYEHFADKVYVLEDFFDTAHIYLRLLVKKAQQTDTPVRISYDPVDLDRVNAVFFPNDRRAFVISSGKSGLLGDVKVNMKRFVDAAEVRKIRSEYRLNSRLAEAFMDSAVESLAAAGKYHFELENIYAKCMDFEEKEVFSKNFFDNLFSNKSQT